MKAIFGILIMVLFTQPAIAAELFVNGSLGVTQFQKTAPDGIWYQEAFPHSFDTTDLGWKAGLGLQFDNGLFVTGNYVKIGKVKVQADFVFDNDYDPVAHTCLANCSTPHHLAGYDSLQGPELAIGYKWNFFNFNPFVKFGGALFSHHIRMPALTYSGQDITQNLNGYVASVVLGSGVCYEVFCVEADYYKGVSSSQSAIATDAFTTWAGIQLPIRF